MTDWIITFAITIAIEIAVAYPILGLGKPKRERARLSRVGIIVLSNVITHPFVYGMASLSRIAPVIIALELGASLVEAILYKRLLRQPTASAVAASFMANAASVLASLVFWYS